MGKKLVGAVKIMEALNMPPTSTATLMQHINHEGLPATRNKDGVWVVDAKDLAKWAGAKEREEKEVDADKAQTEADEADAKAVEERAEADAAEAQAAEEKTEADEAEKKAAEAKAKADKAKAKK